MAGVGDPPYQCLRPANETNERTTEGQARSYDDAFLQGYFQQERQPQGYWNSPTYIRLGMNRYHGHHCYWQPGEAVESGDDEESPYLPPCYFVAS